MYLFLILLGFGVCCLGFFYFFGFFFGLHFCLQDLPNNDFLYHINTLAHFVELGSENKTHYHMHPHTDRHTDSG